MLKLSSDKIVKYIKEHPGVIQESTFPNPGEPDVGEEYFTDPTRWFYFCWGQGNGLPGCDDGSCADCQQEDQELWLAYDDRDPADQVLDEIKAWIEDGQLVFEAD